MNAFTYKAEDFVGFHEDFEFDCFKRCRDYRAKVRGPCVAIFDLGTHSTRLLVAPRTVPAVFDAGSFFNDSVRFKISEAVTNRRKTLSPHHPTFLQIIKYARAHIENLKSIGVTSVKAAGTEVYRRLENVDEIQRAFLDGTGVELEIVSHRDEGRFSIRSIPFVLARRPDKPSAITDNDVIMLADQGGGSLELTWMPWADRNLGQQSIVERLFENLGTDALKWKFFRANKSGVEIEPLENRRTIANQIQHITQKATDAIELMDFDPKKLGARNNGKIHLFGLGSAVTMAASELLREAGFRGRPTNFHQHGTTISRDQIVQRLDRLKTELDAGRQQVLTFYKAVNGLDGEGVARWAARGKDRLEEELTLLYGLPVILALMERANVDHIVTNGYGLRYSHYLLDCEAENVSPDDKGPYLFVSYARADSRRVRSDLKLMAQNRVRFWYDEGLQPGQEFPEQLKVKIAKSSAFFCFITPASVEREWVVAEVVEARKHGKPMIGVQLEDFAIPPAFRGAWGPDTQILKRFSKSDPSFIAELKSSLPAKCFRT